MHSSSLSTSDRPVPSEYQNLLVTSAKGRIRKFLDFTVKVIKSPCTQMKRLNRWVRPDGQTIIKKRAIVAVAVAGLLLAATAISIINWKTTITIGALVGGAALLYKLARHCPAVFRQNKASAL